MKVVKAITVSISTVTLTIIVTKTMQAHFLPQSVLSVWLMLAETGVKQIWLQLSSEGSDQWRIHRGAVGAAAPPPLAHNFFYKKPIFSV